MSIVVKTEKIEGHTVTFSVDEDGSWTASCARLSRASIGKTIPEARSKITRRLRRETANLSIEAHIVNALPESEEAKEWYQRDDKVRASLERPIVVTGIASDGSVLYRYDDFPGGASKKGHSTSHTDADSVGVFTRRLNATDRAMYRRLRDEYDRATLALKTWIGSVSIPDLKAFAEKQIDASVDREPTVDEPTSDPRDSAPTKRSRR